MDIALDAAIEQRIQRQLDRGAFRDPAELLTHALDLVEGVAAGEDRLLHNKAAINADLDRTLGPAEGRTLPARPPIEVPLRTLDRLQAKVPKLEVQRIKEEARAADCARALANAEEHNAKVFDWIQNTFRDMYGANLIAGLLPPIVWDSSADGHLYLQGESRESALNYLCEPRFQTVRGLGYQGLLFTGGFYDPKYKFARVSISRHFISESLPAGHVQHQPGADRIRDYLHSLISNVGSPEYEMLIRIRRKLDAKHARFCREWEQEWRF